MYRRLRATAATFLIASLLLTGCTAGNEAGTSTKTDPEKASAPATPTPAQTMVSAECADAVFDLLVEEINTGETPEYRPDACQNLTDAQWSKVVDEQADKLLAAGELAVENSSSGSGAATGTGDAEDPGDQGATSKVTFKVWGEAPAGIDITYGSDSENLQGTGLPMTKTIELDWSALYWHITAQLHGSGDIRCSVMVDGQTEEGHARGGYNICSAQINNL